MYRRGVFGVLCVLAVCAGPALAVDSIGSPVATLKQGRTAIGAEFNVSERELDCDLDCTLARLPFTNLTGEATLRRTSVTGSLAYGLTDNVDVFVRLGGSTQELADRPTIFAEGDFEGSGELTVGGGVRVTVLEIIEGVKLGTTVQANYHRLRDTVSEPGGGLTFSYDLEADTVELTAATGVQIALQPITVHGGVFVSYLLVNEDFDVFVNGVPAASVGLPCSSDIDTEGVLGAFVGARFSPTENLSIAVNVNVMDHGYGIGGGVMLKL
jgi:hypothetical protein